MPSRMTIQCPRCGNPFDAVIESIVDAGQDPQAKIRLLSGQFNAAQCPRCGTPSGVATPLLYHDPVKELLITFVPMELGLPKDRQEKVVGDLMRELMTRIPQQSIKGYMFQPRQALTMQGLVDQILEADGVTPQMLEEQRARVRLVEMFIQTPEDDLPALVEQYDAEIDAQFFQTFTLIAQRLAQEGRPDLAEHALGVQEHVIELSTFGQEIMAQSEVREQTVQEVAEDLRALGVQAQREDFLNLAIQYADDDERLQALVGLARPAMDYAFFQVLTTRISQAPAAERDSLAALRDRLLELTSLVDRQAQMAVQDAAQFLQVILSSPDPDTVIRANVELIDDTFMAVLSANIQEAERSANIALSAKLKDAYQRVVTVLRDHMQPELRFINELLSTGSNEEARAILAEHAPAFGPGLLDMMDAVRQALETRGDNGALLGRLAFLREEAEQMLQ